MNGNTHDISMATCAKDGTKTKGCSQYIVATASRFLGPPQQYTAEGSHVLHTAAQGYLTLQYHPFGISFALAILQSVNGKIRHEGNSIFI